LWVFNSTRRPDQASRRTSLSAHEDAVTKSSLPHWTHPFLGTRNREMPAARFTCLTASCAKFAQREPVAPQAPSFHMSASSQRLSTPPYRGFLIGCAHLTTSDSLEGHPLAQEREIRRPTGAHASLFEARRTNLTLAIPLSKLSRVVHRSRRRQYSCTFRRRIRAARTSQSPLALESKCRLIRPAPTFMASRDTARAGVALVSEIPARRTACRQVPSVAAQLLLPSDKSFSGTTPRIRIGP